MENTRTFVFMCLFLIIACNSSDVFHERSRIMLKPDVPADFFGYAIAFSESSIIVGAPKAITHGPSPVKSGDVFNCTFPNFKERNFSCTPMNFGQIRYLKNDSWFGASLAVGTTGKVVVCAPRRIQPFRRNLKMNGACFLQTKRLKTLIYPVGVDSKQDFRTSTKKKEYADYNIDSNSSYMSYPYHKYAGAGMAVKVTSENIIIGAPGLLEWSGGVILYSIDSKVNSIKYSRKPSYNPYFTEGLGPDEYFGYSVDSGVFEDSGNMLFVAGGPKGKGGFGVVLVFEPPAREEVPLKIVAKLEGTQIGAYFGASLCCLDVNADGRMDLLVGAPNYVKSFHRDDLYDQGTVYVYLNKEQDSGFVLEYSGQVTGSEANGAKFGYTIADLGDINGDVYRGCTGNLEICRHVLTCSTYYKKVSSEFMLLIDVAVSAPWEDSGAGAVYIYTGSEHGLNSHYTQRIVASESKTFGIGLTRGTSPSQYFLDKNLYNDLIIGAPETGTVYVYRCIPSVKIETTIKIPGALNLPQNTTHFTAQFCIDASPLRDCSSINLGFKATVTVDPKYRRAMVVENPKYNISISHLILNKCEEKIIVIKPSADLSKPISILFDVEPIDAFQDNPTQFLTYARRVSEYSTMHSELNIQLMRDCGEDLICKPWLEMTLQALSNPYVPGAKGRLGAIVKVINIEEPAFGIHVNLTLPSQPKRVPKTCNLRELMMICDLPSPLNRNASVTWEIEFEYTQDMKEMGITMIQADIDDPVTNRNVSDNDSQYLEIDITPKANLNGSGKALPNTTISVTRDKFSEGSSISFVHFFQVTNAGPSDLSDVITKILISEKASLIPETVAGCIDTWDPEEGVALYCNWPVKAKESLLVELPLRYDLKTEGKSLEEEMTCNITTSMFIIQRNNSKTVSITTTLVLEPAPPFWIPVIVGTVVGLLLLAIISYTVYKRGFFTRARHPDYKQLQNGASLGNNGGSMSSLSLDGVHPNDSDADEAGPSSRLPFSSEPKPVTQENPALPQISLPL